MSQFFVPELKEEIIPLNTVISTWKFLVYKHLVYKHQDKSRVFFYVLEGELLEMGRTGSSNSVGVVV